MLLAVTMIAGLAIVLAAVILSADEEANIRERRIARDFDLRRPK